MSIIKAEVLSIINSRLNRTETSIDEELRSVLYDISTRGNLLNREATRNTEAEVRYYSVPANFKDMTELKIDNNEPLDRISYKQFLIVTADDTSQGEPEQYAIQNNFIWLDPNPNKVYVMTMFYSIFHPNNVDIIEFPERFRECIYEGVLAKVCEKYEDGTGLSNHTALYETEINKRLDALDDPMRFIQYHDL